MAGTGLRKVLNSLATPTKNGVPALKSIGLDPSDFKDAQGNMLSLDKMMDLINSKTKNYSDGDKLTLFHKIFGATGQEAALILSKNSHELGKLNNKIADSQNQGKDGYVANIAEQNMNTAQAQLNRLKESGKALATSYAVTVLPAVNDIAKKAADLTNNMSNASPFVKGFFSILATGVPLLTAGAFAFSGIAKTIGVYKGVLNGVRTAFARLTGSNRTQESQIKRQTAEYKELTAAIKQNTKMKEVNSGVDLSGGSGSVSGGSKNSKTNSGGSKSTSAKSKNNNVVQESEKLGKGGKLGKAASKLGYLGLGLDALNVGTGLIGGGQNTGKNVGSAIGGAAGMLIPIPGVDLAASLGLGYAGGKIGEVADKNNKEQDNRINKKREQQGEKPVKYSYFDNFNRNVADSDDKGYGIKMSKSAKENADWEFNFKRNNFRAPTEDEKLDHENSQSNKKGKNNKFAYDSLGGGDSGFLKKWLKDQNDATMAWATTTGKSTSSIQKSYDKLINDASSYADQKNKQEKKDLDTLVKRGIITQNEADNTLQAEKSSSENRLNTVKNTIERIKNIDINGGKGRQQELERLNKQLLSMTDKGSKDQKLILSQLNNDTAKISKDREFELITASKKAKDETISNANKQYKTTTDGAYKTYSDTVERVKGQSQWTDKQKKDAIKKASEQYDSVVSKAQTQKTDTVHWATVQYNQVVSKAQEQADSVSSAINSVSTSLGDLMNGTNGVTSAVSSYVGAISHATPDLASSLSKNNNNINNIASGNVRVQQKSNKEKNSTGFGDFSQLKKYNAFALGGRSARDETALMNEDGEESIYNRKKGTFNVVKGKAGLVKLHSGDEVINAEQTKELLGSKPKRKKPNNAYANGVGGKFADSKIPLTNKSKSVEMILKSLEFMFGNGNDSSSKSSSNSNAKLISTLMKSNEEKDKKIDNILDKMDILISSIQNKPVISEADIYKANKKQTQNQQRFSNLGKGAFS